MERPNPTFIAIDGENTRVAEIKGAMIQVSDDCTLVSFQLLAQVRLNPGEIAPDGGGLAVMVVVTKTPDHQTFDPPPFGLAGPESR